MKYKILIMTALMAGAVGCSVNDLEVEQEEPLKIVFAASPFEDGDKAIDTKTSVIPNESYSSYEFIWSAKDTVGIYPDVGSQIYFTMENGAGASSASFDGGAWTCKEGHTFRSYYPFIGNIYLDATQIPVSFTGQKQVGNDNSDHFQKCDYMYTAVTSKENGVLNFSYHHLITVVLPWVELPAGHYTGIKLSLDEAIFVTKGEYSLVAETPAIVGKQFSNEIDVELDVTFNTADILKVYVPLAPLDMSGKTLTITVTDENDQAYQYTYNPSKAYEAGKIYRLRSPESFADPIISFADNAVKAICVANWDTNGDGELSYEEAAAVTAISADIFQGNTDITTFDEFKFFSGITALPVGAFLNCYNLASIVLPDNIISIGTSTFLGCSRLQSLSVPDGVSSIGSRAFNECVNLDNIQLPSSLRVIENALFANCRSLTSIVLPDGVTSIGDSAFSGCSSLISIVIPDSVTSIGDSAFSGCSTLSSIYIPRGVMQLKGDTFKNCTGLMSVNISDLTAWMRINFYGNYSNPSYSNPLMYAHHLVLDGVEVESVSFPEGVTNIGRNLRGGSAIKAVTLPDSATSIEKCAFEGCSSITSLVIPDGVTSIGESAFSGCRSLSSINIPNNVTSINDKAFLDCSKLTSIVIPEGVTIIDDYVFKGCSNLSIVSILGAVTSVYGSAFEGCSNLTSITLPNDVKTIGQRAFMGCSSLTHMSIPDGVTHIDYYAFFGCSNLNVTVLPTNPPYLFKYNNLYNTFTNVLHIYVRPDYVDAYKQADGWSTWSSIIEAIPE